MDKILKEQNFSNSDRADANTAAKIGRILGVDAIIVGDITQFGRDDQNKSLGGALGHWDKYGLGSVGTKKAKAVVEITARIIDVNTAEILTSEQGMANHHVPAPICSAEGVQAALAGPEVRI